MIFVQSFNSLIYGKLPLKKGKGKEFNLIYLQEILKEKENMNW